MDTRKPDWEMQNLEEMAWKEKKRRKRRKIASVITAWLFAIILFAVLTVGVAAVVMTTVGGNRLKNKGKDAKPNLATEESSGSANEEADGAGTAGNADGSGTNTGTDSSVADTDQNQAVVWQEDWVRHDAKVYEYNDDIMTFLFMGIDKTGEVKESKGSTDGGQADGLFLAVMNPDEKKISIIAVNRDTMTDISMYGIGEEGSVKTTQAQIAVQHGFGDGKEISCELTRDAVSELFYDLPIHGYVAVNMGAISKLNDAVGGVEVTVLEDLTKANKELKKDAKVTLKGQNAFLYVKWRDTEIFESNRGRLARQKQYLTAFINKVKEATKKDITVPITLYEELSKYTVTDVTVEEAAYLTGELLDYTFDGNAIYTLEGTTKMGKKHEEFYPDKDALRDLMIQVFYQEVETTAQNK